MFIRRYLIPISSQGLQFFISRPQKKLRYPDHKDRIFNLVISDISVLQRETALTLSDFIDTGSPLETEKVKMISLSIMEKKDNTI